MDIVSHALIGKIVSVFGKKRRNSDFWAVLFAIIPDFTLIPFYLMLGYQNNRPLFIAYNQDWVGASSSFPVSTAIYFLFHSFIFAFVVVLPLVIFFKIPKIAFAAYLSHLIVDIPTHAGEWAIRVFYPFSNIVDGFTNAWAWPLSYMAVSWLVLIVMFYLIKFFTKK